MGRSWEEWRQGLSTATGVLTGCAAAGDGKVDAPEAGKPELPQQEPAVGPGQKVDIPESRDEAPLPKADAPNPLGGLFGGEPC